jgi:hypothetical protein
MVRLVKAPADQHHPLDPDWVPQPGRRVASRVIDGRALLLDPADDRIHVLNEVGTFIWNLVNERRHTVRDLTLAVISEFEIDEETANSDLREFLQGLAAQGFIGD